MHKDTGSVTSRSAKIHYNSQSNGGHGRSEICAAWSPRDRERIIAKIEQYAENPASLARRVTALTGSDYRRLRVGHHRVIFTTQHGEPSTLIVLRVRHRREADD